jgi:hypothetical protein
VPGIGAAQIYILLMIELPLPDATQPRLHLGAGEQLILLDFATGTLHVPNGVCEDREHDLGQLGAPSDFPLCGGIDPFAQAAPPRTVFGDAVDEDRICRRCIAQVDAEPRGDGRYLGADVVSNPEPGSHFRQARLPGARAR